MTPALQKIIAAFPEFQANVRLRPDGGCLLTLNRADGAEVRRVVAASQMNDERRAEWLVSAMRRDMALQFGEVLPVESLRMLRQSALPTYNHI